MKIKKPSLAGVVLWIVLAVIAAAIVVLALLPKGADSAPAAEERAVAVTVQTVRETTIPDTIVLPGRVEALHSAALSAEVGGRVVRLPVEKGARVSAGDLLLQIDDRVAQAQLQQAEVEHADAVREERRFTELRSTGAVSTSDYERVVMRRELAAAVRTAAQTAVDRCRIESPIGGILDGRDIEVGEYVVEGVPVLRVVDVARVKIAVDVPEDSIDAVRTGMTIPFRRAGANAEPRRGEVVFAAETADAATHTFRVELEADNSGGRLKPGMLVNVPLQRAVRENAIVAPLHSIVPKRGDDVVFLAQDGRAAARVVRIDGIIDSDAVIASGLEAGDALIVAGQRALQDGQRIEVQAAE